VPDANILTLTETLEAVRRMCDAVRIPVVADCDNGYGNAINVMRTVTEFERAGAAGLCIEDNEFPKRCSFYAGVSRDLVAVDEHARKVQAACAARRNRNFVVIARTEALIAGIGMDEALLRARAYADAGADAVLVHSKAKDFGELKRFTEQWDRPVPLVAVPTTYPTVTPAELYAAGFRLGIFANQPLRAAIVAMRAALREMRTTGQISSIEDRIATLEDVYALVGVSELKANEKRFLFSGAQPPKAIILAAGFEPQLMPLIADKPKTMLEVHGKSILERQVTALGQLGIRDVVVVRGYKKEKVQVEGARFVDNDRFADTGELFSLFTADAELHGAFVLLYGDLLFEASILEKLVRTRADVALVVDRSFYDAHRAGVPLPPNPLDLVVTSTPPNGRRFVPPTGGSRVLRIGPDVSPDDAHGEYIGMAMFSAAGATALQQVRTELTAARAEGLDHASITHILQAMIDRGLAVVAVDIHKGWTEVDSADDYRRAWAEVTP
jgi:phosphoenolpyruvate phosphomutase